MPAKQKTRVCRGCVGGPTAGVVGDPSVGGGTPREAPALPPDCHDHLLQADAVHALCQIAVPAYTQPLHVRLIAQKTGSQVQFPTFLPQIGVFMIQQHVDELLLTPRPWRIERSMLLGLIAASQAEGVCTQKTNTRSRSLGTNAHHSGIYHSSDS